MKTLLKKILGVVLCLPAIIIFVLIFGNWVYEIYEALNSWNEIKLMLQVGGFILAIIGITVLGSRLLTGDNQ